MSFCIFNFSWGVALLDDVSRYDEWSNHGGKSLHRSTQTKLVQSLKHDRGICMSPIVLTFMLYFKNFNQLVSYNLLVYAIICMLHRFTQAASVNVSSSWLSNNTNEGNIGATKSRRQTAVRGIWRRHWRMQSNDKHYKSLLKIICHSFHVGFTSLLVILPFGNFSAEMEVKEVFSCTKVSKHHDHELFTD